MKKTFKLILEVLSTITLSTIMGIVILGIFYILTGIIKL